MAHDTLGTLVGHREVIRGLRARLNKKSIPHASIFSGPSGIGKATVAAAFIRSLMCTHDVSNDSLGGCGQCDVCHKISVRCHSDVQWVEKEEDKTRISIDRIRELSRFLSLTPMESEWKVAVVDDAAEMNAAAANALLKTLEEPPANSILILVTCRPGMLLPTIRSRCVVHGFQSLSREEFSSILKGKVTLTDAALQSVMNYSEGNLGIAMQFIEEGRLEGCERLSRDLDMMMRQGRLSGACDVAEEWSDASRFFLARFVIRQWLADRVRDCLVTTPAPERVRGWLVVATSAEKAFALAEAINVNKRLLLEGIFIRILRISGAVP
ncbi:MAG: DNA polymerase III subunit delta' [Magnetococcales bacterium]|nr:DNA polymerase III subunit delta' [Magnetococcales bacterium]